MKKVLLSVIIACVSFISYGQLLTKDQAKQIKKEHGKKIRRFGNTRTGGTQSFVCKYPVVFSSLAGTAKLNFRFKVTDVVEDIKIIINIKGDYSNSINSTFEGITLRVGGKKDIIKEVFVPMKKETVSVFTGINEQVWTTFVIPMGSEVGEKTIDALFKSKNEKVRIFIENGIQFNPAIIACRGLTDKELYRLNDIIEFREIVIKETK